MNRIPRWVVFLIIACIAFLAIGAITFYFITKQPESVVTQKIIKPVVGFLSGFKQFEDIDASAPAYTLTAAELQGDFAQNETDAKLKYEGKVVQVSGIISSIASHADTNHVILLEVDGISNISCQMDSRFNDRFRDISPGSNVSLKGICSGSKKDDLLGSLDVLLNRCVIVK